MHSEDIWQHDKFISEKKNVWKLVCYHFLLKQQKHLQSKIVITNISITIMRGQKAHII